MLGRSVYGDWGDWRMKHLIVYYSLPPRLPSTCAAGGQVGGITALPWFTNDDGLQRLWNDVASVFCQSHRWTSRKVGRGQRRSLVSGSGFHKAEARASCVSSVSIIFTNQILPTGLRSDAQEQA